VAPSAYGSVPHTNGAAYADVVSGYAALGWHEVREPARCHVDYFGSRLNWAFDQK